MTLRDGPVSAPKVTLPSDFALFVGNVSAERKNVLRLIGACDSLGLPLVLAGLLVQSPTMKLIEAQIAKSKIKVYRLGFLDETELRWLYQNCSVFCLPSLVEGVGQVAMEAMYFGAPVVVTKVGGPPDYFGEFAEYVNPHLLDSIRVGIEHALSRKKDLDQVRKHLNQFGISSVARVLEYSYLKNV